MNIVNRIMLASVKSKSKSSWSVIANEKEPRGKENRRNSTYSEVVEKIVRF